MMLVYNIACSVTNKLNYFLISIEKYLGNKYYQ